MASRGGAVLDVALGAPLATPLATVWQRERSSVPTSLPLSLKWLYGALMRNSRRNIDANRSGSGR